MIAIFRLGIALLLLLVSLCTVVPVQTYSMWELSVVATEWGQWIALVSLVMLIIPTGGNRSVNRIARPLLALSMVLSILPTARAMAVGRRLDDRIIRSFGLSKVRSLPGAPARTTALSLPSLFAKPPSPEVRIQTMPFVVRDGIPLQLDLYTRESASRPMPLVVILYGGSWKGGTKSDLPDLNRYLAARGYAVVAPSYRFAPQHPFPSQTEDVNAAIDFIKANASKFDIDSTKIALIGRSAGGQLALQSAYTKNDPAIRGVVSLYGPTDQKWGWDHPTNQRVYKSFTTLRDFLHGSPAESATAYHDSSPINYVGPHTIPTLAVHGTIDPLVSPRQSARLDSAIAANRREHLFIEMPWATHGCDYFFNGPCGQVSTFAIERFLGAVLK